MHSKLATIALTLSALSPAFAAEVSYLFNVVNADLSPDGVTRSTVSVNGGFPGTTITANKGDTLRVNVSNQLTDTTMRRSTSIHWHGLLQARHATEDGPAFVTQCPIGPGSAYEYVMPLADQAGTFWYHSHLSSQYVDGLRGALVIYDPDDPNLSLYDVDDESTIIQIGDWYQTVAPTLQTSYFATSNAAAFREPVPDSGTINGLGRSNNGGTPDRAVINVTSGQRYRLRVINTSAIGTFRFSIVGHTLTVIEADGISTEPLTVDYFDILAGQRYSVVVNANQTVDNYWIRAPMTVANSATNTNLNTTNVLAVLHYDGAADAEPTSAAGTASGTALAEKNLVPLVDPGAPGGSATANQTFNLAFSRGTDSNGAGAWFINGVQYIPPTVPTLLNILANGAVNSSFYGTNEQTFFINKDEIIDINLSGLPGHPFHLHGHAFDVIHSASDSTGVTNYVNPPRRDVLATAGATAVTIRFKADNPGPWILHCHIDWHLEGGLAVVFAEAPDEQISGDDSVIVPSAWSNLCPLYASLPEDQQ